MVLSDINTYRQIIGGLMKNPLFLTEFQDIQATDFDIRVPRLVFIIIYNKLKGSDAPTSLTPFEVDIAMEEHEAAAVLYKQEKGLEFLKEAYELASIENFEYYYKRLKKLSLLRALKKNGYDISSFYKENFDTMREEDETIQRFEEANIEDILLEVEKKYNKIKADFINGGKNSGNAAAGLIELVEDLKRQPEIGPSLCGSIMSTVFRGARKGKFYTRSSGSGVGKTRNATFDACHIAFPEYYIINSNKEIEFIHKVDKNGNEVPPRKTLFITTEMGKDEIQTIMLAYLSKVNEAHILTGKYDIGEYERVMRAAKIIEKYQDYFYLTEISNPDLTNIEATIKRYATIEKVEYVFYDYLFTSPSLIAQFAGAVREDVALTMLSNQLKQLAKDYNLFIFSSTQVNANAMEEGFKNESCIRGM